MRDAAKIIKGRKIAQHVNAMVVPGSGLVKQQAEQEGIDKIFKDWLIINKPVLLRWHHMLDDFKMRQSSEFAMFSVALRELKLLCLNCDTTK